MIRLGQQTVSFEESSARDRCFSVNMSQPYALVLAPADAAVELFGVPD